MRLRQKALRKINRYFPIFNLENYADNLNATQNTELKLCYDNKTGKFVLLTVEYLNTNKETFPPRIFLKWPEYPNNVTASNCPIVEELKNRGSVSSNSSNIDGILYWCKLIDLALIEN